MTRRALGAGSAYLIEKAGPEATSWPFGGGTAARKPQSVSAVMSGPVSMKCNGEEMPKKQGHSSQLH